MREQVIASAWVVEEKKEEEKSPEKTTDEKYENVLHYVPLIFMLMALGFRWAWNAI